MINWRSRAEELLKEFELCKQARPRGNSAEVQLEKDSCAKWAQHLATQKNWGSEIEIAEACNQLEPRLKQLQQKVIIEILNHGSI
jgi:hypothetical protein